MAKTPRQKGLRGRFGAAGVAPGVTIVNPGNGDSFGANTTVDSPAVAAAEVSLKARAGDDILGDLTSSIMWTSSIDGALGTGGTITATLTTGTHIITASATDGTLTGTDKVQVVVS